MKVNLKKFKIEKAASRDETRPVLNSVYLDRAHSVLVATDGYGVAVIPVNELALDDVEGLIPAEAIALARADQGKRDDAELSANGCVGVTLRGRRVEFDREDAEKFPNWVELMETTGRPVAAFSMSPKVLQAVADAIGAGGGSVKIEVFAPGKPLRVTPLYEEDGWPRARGIVGTYKLSREAAA